MPFDVHTRGRCVPIPPALAHAGPFGNTVIIPVEEDDGQGRLMGRMAPIVHIVNSTEHKLESLAINGANLVEDLPELQVQSVPRHRFDLAIGANPPFATSFQSTPIVVTLENSSPFTVTVDLGSINANVEALVLWVFLNGVVTSSLDGKVRLLTWVSK